MNEKEFESEVLEITGKTALSLIPVGGTLITLIIDSVKEHSLRKRAEEWKETIEDRLSKLERTVDELGNDEMFTSALLIASEIAAKTADSTKREYLANAVVNSVGSELEENKMIIFLHLIDKYTTWHIRLLDYFRNPSEKGIDCSSYLMGSPITPIKELFPDICAEEGLVEKIVLDLQNDGILQKGDFLHTSMTSSGMIAARTTKLGNELLDFVLN